MTPGQQIKEDLLMLLAGMCFVVGVAAMIVYALVMWPIDVMRKPEPASKAARNSANSEAG